MHDLSDTTNSLTLLSGTCLFSVEDRKSLLVVAYAYQTFYGAVPRFD